MLNTFHTKEYYAPIKTNKVELSAQIVNNLQDLLNEKSKVQSRVLKIEQVGGGTYAAGYITNTLMSVESTVHAGEMIYKCPVLHANSAVPGPRTGGASGPSHFSG